MPHAMTVKMLMEKAAGPTTKRHRSAQDLETPWEFIKAVTKKFGEPTWDLAATSSNSKADFWYGPESAFSTDSLIMRWHEIQNVGKPTLLWLNPQFDPIRPWVEKCATESQLGAEILLLAQASIDSNWFEDYVWPYATVYAIKPRLRFVGHKDCYPKPLMLCHYCAVPNRELQIWRWKQ